MLKRKILANTSVYVSTEHKDVLINKYLDNLSQVFKEIVKIEDGMDYSFKTQYCRMVSRLN